MNPRIKKALEYMVADLSQPLRLEKAARAIGYCVPYFCTEFRSATGETPARYHKRLRLDRAGELLLSQPAQPLSVKQAATQTGFYDVSHFVRDFTQQYGLSPKHYQARHFGWEDNC